MRVLLYTSHGGALTLCWLLPVPPGWALLLSTALALLLFHSLQQHFGSAAIVALVWERDGRWQLRWHDGSSASAELCGDSYLSPRLVILRFHRVQSPGSSTLVLLPDSLDADTFRRLRVRLHQHGATPAD